MRYKDFLYKTTSYSFLEVLNTSNPFYLMLDKKGVILSAGDFFKTALEDELEGKLLPCFLRFKDGYNFSQIQQESISSEDVDEMENISCTQRYKITLHTSEEYIFIFGRPVINDTYSLSNYKIHLHELRNHDYLANFILMRQHLITEKGENKLLSNQNITGTMDF